jgi:uncharacterized protein
MVVFRAAKILVVAQERARRAKVAMRLAVISDTHLESPSVWFERVYDRHLADADALIHCGDIAGPGMLHYLMQHPDLYAVAGNMDAHWAGPELPASLTFELQGVRIGVAHGWGSRSGVPGRVAEAFGPGYGLICYGHTHQAKVEPHQGATLLNPGSLAQHGEPSLAYVILDKTGVLSVNLHKIDRNGALG